MTRLTLDVFNCQPTTPSDGKEYMLAVFEECGVPGGTQLTLMPFAFVTLAVYVIGFPAFVAFKLRANRKTVMKDQVLRAMGKGDTISFDTNEFRRKYHKMYYHFKPEL